MLLTNYATRSETIHRENKTVQDFWPIGIDYGFSGIKGFSPNKVFCFPNCAVKVNEEAFKSFIDPNDDDIMLKDESGLWVVGAKASEIISPTDAMNYETEMYERNRYFSPVFGAIMKVGLAIALSSNHVKKYRGETIVIQTGLPPKYKDTDTELIKEALTGSYNFELKIGRNPFQHYEFQVREGNVLVMDQPMGSLISAITDNNGMQNHSDYKILRSNTLVFDPGFKTLDIYDISAGMFKSSNTFDTLGMHEIFKRTLDELKKTNNVNMHVSGMQGALKRGYVTSFNRRLMKSQKINFEEILYKNTRNVCNEAVQKLISLYNYMQDYDYLIITGGTGNAWFSHIQEFLKDMENLTIISANKNDTSLSNTYSNVRGYYLFLVASLARKANSGR